MDKREYFNEIEYLAESIIEEALAQCDSDKGKARELINTSLLKESTHEHLWIFSRSANLDVINNSVNQNYAIEKLGAEAVSAALQSDGLEGLYQLVAAWAFYADVQERVNALLEYVE
jgi:hypothetical protein